MGRKIFGVALVCALLGATGTAGSANAATCYSSTPTSGAWNDPAWDVESYGGTRFAPDITQLRVALDGGCALSVDFTIDSETAASDFYGYWLDADNNLATGSQSGFRGADFSIGKDASNPPALMRVDASGSSTVIKDLPALGTYGAMVHLNDLGVEPGTGLAVAGGTLWRSDSGNAYTDFIPEPGSSAFQFPFAFSATPPQPPAPQQPAAPAPPVQPAPVARPAPVQAQSTAPSCRVPNLKGLTVRQATSRLRQRDCAVGKVFRRASSSFYVGKVIRSSPPAGTTLANGAKVNLRVGKRKARARTASAAPTGIEHVMTRLAAANADR